MNKTSNQVAQYKSAGVDITLTPEVVRDIICRGAQVEDDQVVKFMHLCRVNQLNPFTGEVYLVAYEGKAQMTISKEAYYKRAEAHPEYDGIESGIIVLRSGEVVELEGAFALPTDQVLGAWAKAYRKDRGRPTTAKVSLKEYNKGKSMWVSKPATMIVKVAKVQALREAFPTLVQGIYTEEELGGGVESGQAKAVEPTMSLEEAKARLSEARSIEELGAIYKSFTPQIRADRTIIQHATELKERLANLGQESTPSEYVDYEDVSA